MSRAAFAIFVAVAVAWSAPALADDAEFELNMGTLATKATPWGKQLKKWKKDIEKDSGGRIDVKIHWGGRRGDEVSMVRQTKRNELQAFGGSTGAVSNEVPEMAIFELCYLFDDYDHADKVIDTALNDPITEVLADAGFILYTFGENGFRNFATQGQPIKSPSDLEGLKMRSQETWTHEEAYRAWGGNPVQMPVSEVTSGLKTGNIKGFDNTELFAFATGWYKEIDTWSRTQHIYQPAVIMYNAEWYNALPDDLKKVVMDNADKQRKLGRKLVRKMNKKLVKSLEDAGINVVELSDAERAKFASKCDSVHKQYVDKVGGKAKSLLEAAKSVK